MMQTLRFRQLTWTTKGLVGARKMANFLCSDSFGRSARSTSAATAVLPLPVAEETSLGQGALLGYQHRTAIALSQIAEMSKQNDSMGC